MVHGEERKKIIEKILKGEIKPNKESWTVRANAPPPSNEVFNAMLEVARDEYGRLYGKKTCGIMKRRKWGFLYYLTILIFTIIGPRPSEAVFLQVKDFDLDLKTVSIYKADTKTGKPKAGSEGMLPLPRNAVKDLSTIFKALRYREDDFILSGKRDRFGNPVPITVDEVEHRFKVIARATAQKYPELKIDPKKIYPYIGRQKVSTLLTDIAKDKGLLASEILRHRDTSPGRVAREHYIRHTIEEQREALDRALAGILPEPPPPPPEDKASKDQPT
jgi:integrase